MKERIILAPGANGSELIKSMAVYGVNCFNLRICSAAELASVALMRSGITLTEEVLLGIQENSIISRAVKGESYFGKTTYSDIKKITSAINRMRSLVTDEDEAAKIEECLSKGLFTEKNRALLNVYRKYMEILKTEHLSDRISVIKKAISLAKPLKAEFFVLKEYPLNPVEKALLDKVSAGSTLKEITLSELFNLTEKPFDINSYSNCYGMSNEVEMILTQVYKNNNLDKCTVAVTDSSSYGQLFFDYAVLYDMPVTIGCGIPVINSNPARLLVLYQNWIAGGMFNAGNLVEMINSDAFNSKVLWDKIDTSDENFRMKDFSEFLCGLRLTNDASLNKEKIETLKKTLGEMEASLPEDDEKGHKTIAVKKSFIKPLEVMAEELSLMPEEFIERYSYIRKGADSNKAALIMGLDISALGGICQLLKVIRETETDRGMDDIIKNVLSTSVKPSGCEEGKLYITEISGAFTALRDNLYIAGLSASKYPGAPREDFLLLDDDLEKFGADAAGYTSAGRIAKKREDILNLVSAAANRGSTINVSFPGLNVSELKKDNASSMLFELFKKEKGVNASAEDLNSVIVNVEYFEPEISTGREVGKAYVSGYSIYPNQSAMEYALAKGMLFDGDDTATPGDCDVSAGDDYDESDELEGVKDQAEIKAVSSPLAKMLLEKEYSPSKLEKFFSCPASFLYSEIYGIPEEENVNNFEVISPMAVGNLAHELMGKLGEKPMTLDEFLALSKTYFDRHISINPTLIPSKIESARQDFLEMMELAFESEPHREIVLTEEELHCVHPSGIKLKGFPDRVEKLENGKYLVVDFKTKKRIEHIENDPDTCLQVMLYSLLMEENGYKDRVVGGMYRYLRLGEDVTCENSDEAKAIVLQKLEFFKECLDKHEFPLTDVEDNCKYCSYNDICKGGSL